MQLPALIADRFDLERPAGAGGMGAVYRALDRRSGAVVALKLAVEGEAQRRALAEVDALAALDHPAVVRLVAHGVAEDGRPYIAMEWLEGEDLAARLARAPLPARDAARLGARLAGALAAVHDRGVVHRDIKPSNIFLPGGDVGQGKLVDFGIARLTRAARRLTATGALVGTPGYMAPEQVTGERDVGPPADLFALGAVLFECLAGQPAFEGMSIVALLAKVLLEEPPRLHAVRPDLPARLVDLVARLLAKHPGERPGAAAVAAALEDLLPALEGVAAAGGQAALPVTATEDAGGGITGDEQRLVSVLLIRPAHAGADPAAPAVPGVERGPPRTTALDATAPADQITELARADLEAAAAVRAAVGPLGGRVDRLLDGALVASWLGAEHSAGAPRDQAARAARAALLARRRLPGAALALASGLAVGRGALPLGPALDRAAAQLDAGEAPRAAVLVDDVTAGLLDARFDVRASPSGAGLQLAGRRDLDEEEARLLLGRPAPCIGRERELRVLCDLLDECVAEPVARAALVTAPPGVGKSRLRHELLRAIRERGERGELGEVGVWTACADELGAGSPFALLGAALQRALGAPPGAPLDERHRRIQQRVARHVPAAERARVAAFLGEIADAPFPAATHPLLAPARRDPAMMAEQVRRAWLDLIAAEVERRPVLLVLEDLHRGDAPSLQLVGAALAAREDRPFMVLAFARPEVRDRFPDLWAGRDVQEMRLGGLTRRAAAQLVRHALPQADAALVERLVDRADGNAFYLEELIRTAAAGRGDALPETVAAMVQARLDGLSPEDRRLLRAASVFGESFWRGGALALLGGAERATAAAERLDALVARELLVRRPESRFPAEEELAFRHALLRDGAYAALPEADRVVAHRRAAAWLLEAGEADPLILAVHHERGGEPGTAAACYHRGAARALAGNDPPGARALAERALALGPDAALRPEVLHDLMVASWFGGRLAEAERWCDEVLAAAPRGGGAWCAAAHARFLLLVQHADAGAVPFAVAAADGVEATPENAGSLLRLLSSLSLILGIGGDAAMAEPYRARAEAAAGAFGGSLDPGSLGFFYYSRSPWRLNVELGLEGALRDAEQAVRCFEVAGDRLHEGLARFTLGVALWNLGAFERAEAELRCAVEGSAPGTHSAISGRACLAITLTDRGALDEAAHEAARAVTEAQAVADRFGEIAARIAAAYALLRQGEAAAAEREARAALGACSSNAALESEVVALLASTRLAQGEAAEALALARAVSGPSARSAPAARLVARAVEVEALLAAGEPGAARPLLEASRAEILAIAAGIQDPELRASFLARGPRTARLPQLAEAVA